MITPAQATVDDVYAWVKSTFYEFVHDVGIATDGSDGFLTDLFEPADGECNHIWTYNTDDYKYCERCQLGFEEYYNTKYNQYVSDLQTDLGTTTLIDGGIRIYFKPTLATTYTNCSGSESTWVLHDTYIEGTVVTTNLGDSGGYKSASFNTMFDEGITVPFSANVTYGYEGKLSTPYNVKDIDFRGRSGTKEITANSTVYYADRKSLGSNYYRYYQHTFAGDSIVVANVYYAAWIDVVPISTTLPTSYDISVNSRPSSIVGDYGIMGDDGTIIKVDKTIVDEGHSIVYNPVTNTTYNYTDYAYDYSDRSYNLTLEDGSTMKVVYGDENITIQEGDTIYNVYYLTSGSEGGSGSGGSGDDGSGGIGGAIGGLFDVLGEIIYGLIEGTINLATKALSALTGLLDLLKQFGESIISFFGGYTDFLGAVFPFLPEETFTILNLGLILMIAAAVFKKFL